MVTRLGPALAPKIVNCTHLKRKVYACIWAILGPREVATQTSSGCTKNGRFQRTYILDTFNGGRTKKYASSKQSKGICGVQRLALGANTVWWNLHRSAVLSVNQRQLTSSQYLNYTSDTFLAVEFWAWEVANIPILLPQHLPPGSMHSG